MEKEMLEHGVGKKQKGEGNRIEKSNEYNIIKVT